ncbi:hypothetical protein [Methylophilus methylotrophus]|jgi:hypothetical protein|uniref:hypothetical protein n=1 Tax=Methylophilus methylotrophus TaxID=17 RepID=UPI00036180F7|nr:hypothetical protein [Methylophilus methylotrophus]
MQDISLAELNVPQFLKPKLRLFLSVDIVGSTAFKQSTPKNLNSTEVSPAWFRATTNFYREIDRLFIQEWRALNKENQTDYSWPSGDEPNLWKSAGDELIYTVQIKDYRHVAVYVIAWKRAAEKFRPAIKKFSKSLDLKLTGWIAGFPVINHELILRSGQSEDMVDDDSVVANFRLLQKCRLQFDLRPNINTNQRLSRSHANMNFKPFAT